MTSLLTLIRKEHEARLHGRSGFDFYDVFDRELGRRFPGDALRLRVGAHHHHRLGHGVITADRIDDPRDAECHALHAAVDLNPEMPAGDGDLEQQRRQIYASGRRGVLQFQQASNCASTCSPQAPHVHGGSALASVGVGVWSRRISSAESAS